jgi:hypothetical protein
VARSISVRVGIRVRARKVAISTPYRDSTGTPGTNSNDMPKSPRNKPDRVISTI